MIKMNCLVCNKETYRYPYDTKKRFCSYECHNSFKKRRPPWNKGKKLTNEQKQAYRGRTFSLEHRQKISQAHKGRISPNWRGGITQNLICNQCGIRFNADRASKRFCSNNCKTLSLKGKYPINLKGERGIKPRTYYKKTNKYGSIEAVEWRNKVFKRDNHTCQICKIKGGKLNAHHILPFSKYPTERFNIANGLTLCIKCHSKTDSFGWKNYWNNYLAHQRINNTTTELF